jgi:hypothetical protein
VACACACQRDDITRSARDAPLAEGLGGRAEGDGVGDGLGGGEFGELVVVRDRERRGSRCAADGQLVVGQLLPPEKRRVAPLVLDSRMLAVPLYNVSPQY